MSKQSNFPKDLIAYRELIEFKEEKKELIRKQRRDKGLERQLYGSKIPDRYRYYIYRANKKRLQFTLSIDEFNNLLSMPCSYCGSTSSMTMDRIDSSDGYTQENVLPACYICNTMKFRLSTEAFIKHVKKIYLFNH